MIDNISGLPAGQREALEFVVKGLREAKDRLECLKTTTANCYAVPEEEGGGIDPGAAPFKEAAA